MNATINIHGRKLQQMNRTVASVREARGLAKSFLRSLGDDRAHARVFVDGVVITISQDKGRWVVKEEVKL
jgi:hypothetical protein